MGVLRVWDAAASEWVDVAPSAQDLDDLLDVNAASPDEGDALVWDGSEWVAAAPAAVPSTLDALTDVNTPAPSDGQALVWDATPGEWVAATVAAGLTVEASGETPVTGVDRVVFPAGTVSGLGSGDVAVRELPTGVIGAIISEATAQSLTNDTPTALTSNDAEILDTDGFHDTGSNTSRFTIPAGLGTRQYLITATVFFAAHATGFRQVSVYKGGADQSIQQRTPSYAAIGQYVSLAQIFTLSAGEYVELFASQTSGGALNASLSRFAIYLLGSGNVSGLGTTRARRTSGNLTFASTAWVNVDTGLDLVVAAQVGDVLSVSLALLWQTQALEGILDAATIVGGSPVNYISGGGGTATSYGVPGWYGEVSRNTPVGASVQYVVQAADISGGNVTLRLRYRGSTASTKGFYATADIPVVWSVVNLRGGAASRDVGYEFAYAEAAAADVNITATTAATANTVVTAPAVVFDGNTAVWVEFGCSAIDTPNNTSLLVVLYEGSAQVGTASWGQLTPPTGVDRVPVFLKRRLTPAAGSRTYSVRAWVVSGTGVVRSSVNYMPAFIRITKA